MFGFLNIFSYFRSSPSPQQPSPKQENTCVKEAYVLVVTPEMLGSAISTLRTTGPLSKTNNISDIQHMLMQSEPSSILNRAIENVSVPPINPILNFEQDFRIQCS